MRAGKVGMDTPERSEQWWSFDRGFLPQARDEVFLWKIINDILLGRDDRVLVLTHHNADLDAVASALILKYTFPWLEISAYNSISAPGRNLLERLGVEMVIDPNVEDYDLAIVLDSSSPMQVSNGDVSGWPKHWVIDHHMKNENWSGEVYVDSERSACVEIALQITMLTGSTLTDDMALAGIAGIIADTGKFRFADPADLDICSFLLNGSAVSMEDVLSVIEGENYFDISKKLAQLKAAKRVKYHRIKDQILASSRVSTFEAAAARSLLICGADVVFIGSNRKDDLRISARAKPHILEMGIHLGEFMSKVGVETGNQGGGHDGAAGLNGKGNVDKVLSICTKRMGDLLKEKLYGTSE